MREKPVRWLSGNACCHKANARLRSKWNGLFLLVPILAQALLALVGGNFMTFTFLTAGHDERVEF